MRLFSICQAMNFSALPVAGGIYDQHPQLIEEWMILFKAQAEHQERENARRKAESKKSNTKR